MADLEPELRGVGTRLALPDPPDVRSAVRARIAAPPASRTLAGPRRWVVAVIAALVATALAASPQARAAVADLLRFAGVEVHWGSPDPDAPSRAPLPGQEATGLDAARRAVDFAVRVPAELGEPDRVLVSDSGRVASLLYGSGPGQVRLDVFEGRLDPLFVKTIDEPVEQVDVGEVEGLWLTGPHLVRYVDRDGVIRGESARLSASTLIWEQAAVSYRLEGDLTRDDAIAIAESLR